MEDQVAEFMAITGAPDRKAETYLRVSDGNFAQAVQLYFETGGADMEDPPSSTPAPVVHTRAPGLGGNSEPIDIDDDIEDDDLREALRASGGGGGGGGGGGVTTSGGDVAGGGSAYDDEALARQLQEELYGEGGTDSNEVRAPIARTRETLVGGDDDYGYPDPTRHTVRRRGGGPSRGIFSQRSTSVWDQNEVSSAERRNRLLAEATGGASESSSKSTRLAEMYRPPFEIISPLSLEDARTEAREQEKWILVNVQDSSLFACQTLNRDIWKAAEVMATVKENFLFLQMDRSGVDGRDYIRYYLQKAADPSARFDPAVADLFPHIAIIDPRTGEQVKVWNDVPKEPMEFVMQLHEFLERYSLKVNAKNPVQRTSKVKPNVAHMTEDEMMQLAMQNSLGAARASTEDDPDALTKDTPEPDLMDFEDSSGKGKEPAAAAEDDEDVEPTAFSRIRADAHHVEPPSGVDVTRIQFKMHDGTRIVRKFLRQDLVERLFEYVKADLLPERESKKPEEERSVSEFDLVAMGKKLIDLLDKTVDEAGLRNGTVMVEVMDS